METLAGTHMNDPHSPSKVAYIFGAAYNAISIRQHGSKINATLLVNLELSIEKTRSVNEWYSECAPRSTEERTDHRGLSLQIKEKNDK